jgi:hypothetical protein
LAMSSADSSPSFKVKQIEPILTFGDFFDRAFWHW